MNKKNFLINILALLTQFINMAKATEIVNIYHDENCCLLKVAEAIPMTKLGLDDAQQIAEKLKTTLMPLMPAAGLAAPQIGISKQVFIYSWNRSVENLEIVINPAFTPLDPEMKIRWEGCFSTLPEGGPFQMALTRRYESILASYINSLGGEKQVKLEGFAARAFQHEYDHLQGIVNVHKQDTEVKSFETKKAFLTFLAETKKSDSVLYINPVNHQG